MFKRKTKAKSTPLETQTHEAPKQEAPELFPVSFAIIATQDDWDKHHKALLQTLPFNAEVCVCFNEHGADDTLTDIVEKRLGEATLRFRVWTYSGAFHFGRARQYASDMATNDWVMWLDCDDRLNPLHHSRIKAVTQWTDHGVGAVMCACLSMHAPIPPNTDPEYFAVKQARIYKRSTGAQWEGRCHEQIFPSIQKRGYTHAHSTIIVEHVGYEGSYVDLLPRNRRNVDLLCHEIAERGVGDATAYWLSMLHRDLNSLYTMEKANAG
jgi:hypothetical protein